MNLSLALPFNRNFPTLAWSEQVSGNQNSLDKLLKGRARLELGSRHDEQQSNHSVCSKHLQALERDSIRIQAEDKPLVVNSLAAKHRNILTRIELEPVAVLRVPSMDYPAQCATPVPAGART